MKKVEIEMFIGILEVRIKIFSSETIKEKRQVVKSVLERIKSRFNFSAAEVSDHDILNVSELGFACVSNSRAHADEMMDKLIHFLENDYRYEILEIRREII